MSTNPGRGRAIGLHVFVVTPCRAGGTLWKMDMWQGRVIEGMTLDAQRGCAARYHTDEAGTMLRRHRFRA